MKIISLINQKGGSGKTTSTINIGAGLNILKKKKVLLIDLDPQAQLSASVGIYNPEKSLVDIIEGSKVLEAVVSFEHFDLIPSKLELAYYEHEVTAKFLQSILDQVQKKNYDFVLLDCPPSLNMISASSLLVSTDVIIPLPVEFLPLHGLTQIKKSIDRATESNPNLNLLGIVALRYDRRKNLTKDVMNMINEHLPKMLFKTKIRENVSIAEAPGNEQNIFQYKPNSNGAEDYLNLTKEIIKRIR